MIQIQPSPTADTRTCDYAHVSKETLYASSEQHIGDVREALAFFASKLDEAAMDHDPDKLTDIDGFHADFVTGFAQTGWCRGICWLALYEDGERRARRLTESP